jgi:hypothetical protein
VPGLQRFFEEMLFGIKTDRVAYVMREDALPDAKSGAKWTEDKKFNAADALLSDPDLKAIFKKALADGCTIVTRTVPPS